MGISVEQYQKDMLHGLRKRQEYAEKAMAQVTDEDFFRTMDADSNSIAVIVKHMAGSMRSRWTDFLTTDGESPDRHRDQEFVIGPADTREALLESWSQAWKLLFDTISSLEPDDFSRTVFIRREPHSVVQALTRGLTHYSGHVGQIIFIAKHLVGNRWKTLSIPRGKSGEFLTQGRR